VAGFQPITCLALIERRYRESRLVRSWLLLFTMRRWLAAERLFVLTLSSPPTLRHPGRCWCWSHALPRYDSRADTALQCVHAQPC
jgi:hypothetical protein